MQFRRVRIFSWSILMKKYWKNCSKLMKIAWNWWKLHEIAWNCMKLHEIARRWNFDAVPLAGEKQGPQSKSSSFKLHEKLLKIDWNWVKLHEIAWNWPKLRHAIWGNFCDFCNFWQFHAIWGNLRQFLWQFLGI